MITTNAGPSAKFETTEFEATQIALEYVIIGDNAMTGAAIAIDTTAAMLALADSLFEDNDDADDYIKTLTRKTPGLDAWKFSHASTSTTAFSAEEVHEAVEIFDAWQETITSSDIAFIFDAAFMDMHNEVTLNQIEQGWGKFMTVLRAAHVDNVGVKFTQV